MAPSTTKKALVRRFGRETLAGYIHPDTFLQPEGIELLTEDGNLSRVPHEEVKSVVFVRDFHASAEPERRSFLTRPKMPGLWVSLRFRDGETQEGVLPNNLLQVEPFGLTVIPPDSYGNRQRIFAPRAALAAVEVLGVVGSPLRRRKPKPAAEGQGALFDEG